MKKAGQRLQLLILFLVLAAGCPGYAGEYRCSGSPSGDVENIERARATVQGTFVRLDRSTLKFEGHIDRGTYEQYLGAIDDDVKTLVVNSSGGDSYDGVRIGLDMAGRNIDVIVDGTACSSAANYLFTAGKRKKICRGFVGFHGNAGAIKDRKALEESLRAAAAKCGVSREEIGKVVEATLAVTDTTVKLEKEFLARLGVSQQLFDITQEDGKGLARDVRLDFEFLLPSIQTMERFGIRGVEGRQDVELAERLGLHVIYY